MEYFQCTPPAFPSTAIIQLSFDGISSLKCGVGMVVLESNQVLQELNQCGSRLKSYLISPNYSKKLPDYSPSILKQNGSICSQTGGEVFLVPQETCSQFFGDRAQWSVVCFEAASICVKIINQNPYTIVICHDTVFAHVPLLLSKMQRKEELQRPHKIIWVPHTTSWSYDGHEHGEAKQPERHLWEMEAFERAKEGNYSIGYIGQMFKKHIQKPPFLVQDAELLPFYTGILPDRFLKEISQAKIAKELEKRGIPTNKRLLFSVGRATPLKGHDIVLEAYRKLKEKVSDLHLVLLAPFSLISPEFSCVLKTRIEKEKMEVTFINSFDFDLSCYIYQWSQTCITALLSREDTQPLTVMEARVNPQNSIVLASNRGGMGTQIKNGEDGFICDIEGLPKVISEPLKGLSQVDVVVQKMQNILQLDETERKAILEKGKTLIQEEYNLRSAMTCNLTYLLGAIKHAKNQCT